MLYTHYKHCMLTIAIHDSYTTLLYATAALGPVGAWGKHEGVCGGGGGILGVIYTHTELKRVHIRVQDRLSDVTASWHMIGGAGGGGVGGEVTAG
jgi:hypothetical protein